ncbi:MAG: hypothetical protein ACT4P1_07795 [Sporichthyaceae bacterium]
MLLGLLLVLTGSFLAIVGSMGAIGSGFTLRLLPGRKVSAIAGLDGGPYYSPDVEDGAAADGAPAKAATRVVVRGRAGIGPGGTYTAPLSGQECVWYLASQTAVVDGERRTVDRFSAEPFTLRDSAGAVVLVGPACPGLDQIPPVFRERRTDPHPWFDAAPTGAVGTDADGTDNAIEVFEFVVTADTDLLASGDLGANSDGTPALTGELTLSAGGDAVAAGDPARRNLRRDLILLGAGAALIGAGSLILGFADQDDYLQDVPQRPGLVSPR